VTAVPGVRDSAPPRSASTPERADLARRTIAHALLLGILADALLRDGRWGIALLAWLLAFAATVGSLVTRRGATMTREQRAWLGAAVFFGGCFAWRDAEALQFYDFVAMLVALALLGATLSPASPIRSVLGTRIRDLAHALARAVANGAVGLIVLVLGDSALGATRRRLADDRTRALLRAAAITVPLLLLFGALFSEADPVFGSLFGLPKLDFGVVMSHVLVAGFFTWVVGGWMRGALVDDKAARPLPGGFPLTLGTLEITVVLGALNALFALFVAVQVGWLFGGEALVRSTTGLGYAQYARRGFFELVWVSLLVLPVLLGARVAISEGDARSIRRHRRLSMPLLLLVGATMVSAIGRMRLYVHYYGLTTDRLFALVFMAWLAIVFVWFTLTVLRGRERDFASGMTITGFFTIAALNFANPDAFIARVNVGRAAAAARLADSVVVNDGRTRASADTPRAPVDYNYLTVRLDGEAVPAVVGALTSGTVTAPGAAIHEAEVRERCDAVRRLLQKWAPARAGDAEGARHDADWRAWNLGTVRARASVRAHERELRSVTCWDNGGESPFGIREQRKSLVGEQWYVPPPAPTR